MYELGVGVDGSYRVWDKEDKRYLIGETLIIYDRDRFDSRYDIEKSMLTKCSKSGTHCMRVISFPLLNEAMNNYYGMMEDYEISE